MTDERLWPDYAAPTDLAAIETVPLEARGLSEPLLAGALATHVRYRDGARELAPAVVCAALLAGYLAVLFGATR